MKIVKIFLLFITISGVLQCTSNNILLTEYNGNDGIILSKTDEITNFKFDHYRLNKIMVVGDLITINVSYNGGCRDHTFNLIAKDNFSESSNPKVDLRLAHNSNFDPCEEYVTENQIYNLLPLKYVYVKTFGKEIGSIRLALEEKDVVYNF